MHNWKRVAFGSTWCFKQSPHSHDGNLTAERRSVVYLSEYSLPAYGFCTVYILTNRKRIKVSGTFGYCVASLYSTCSYVFVKWRICMKHSRSPPRINNCAHFTACFQQENASSKPSEQTKPTAIKIKVQVSEEKQSSWGSSFQRKPRQIHCSRPDPLVATSRSETLQHQTISLCVIHL